MAGFRSGLGIAAVTAGGALLFGACGDSGAEPDSTQERVTETVPHVVDSTMGSTQVLAESETLAEAGESLEQVGQLFGFTPAEEDGGFGDDGSYLVRAYRSLQDEPGGPIDGDMSGDEFAEFLNERVFIDENYEGDGYYRIGGAMLCPDDPTTGAPDPQCVEEADAAELRLRAVLVGDDGVDLSLAVGEDRVEPVVVELRPESAAFVVNFYDLRAAIEFFADLADEEVDDIPEVFEGEVALTLTVLGENHVSADFAVREEIRIEDDDVGLSVAARDPLFELEANEPEESVTARLDVGPLQVEGPWEAFAEESQASGDFELDWQGLTAEITLEEGAQTLQIEDVSLGEDTSTLSLDGEVLFGLDLNAEADRSFTLTVHPGEDGAAPRFGFDPEFDLELELGFEPLADAGDDVPEVAHDDALRFALTGSEPTLQPVEAEGEFSGGLRVDAGELEIASREADREVEVPEGDCLIEREPEDGDHPLLGALAAGACE